MKISDLYEQQLTSQAKIEKWLEEQRITEYEIFLGSGIKQFLVNVNKKVNISNLKLKEIPVKFHTVMGNFDCSMNFLTTLENIPTALHGKLFCCFNKKMTSLKSISKRIEYCEEMDFTGTPITHDIMGLLMISGLKKVIGLPEDITKYITPLLMSSDFWRPTSTHKDSTTHFTRQELIDIQDDMITKNLDTWANL